MLVMLTASEVRMEPPTVNITSMTNNYCWLYSVVAPDDGQ